MITKLKSLRILVGIIVFSLVIPLAPAVSLAEAKICCKKKCSKMMRSMVKSGQESVNHCNHKSGPVDCCEKNCSDFLSYEKSERYSVLGSRLGMESSPLNISFLTVHSETISYPPNFHSKHDLEPFHDKTKNPPIFIKHSSLLI